ncbi:MAG: hypothetical protein A3B68_00800 [Candidatus Melainabacteria bacterium RIFCSPHIGHO2_02_FULL_34_12]|nr:MAG: hypothetical protein A3B68_00800 [Candidatus Melainabacteria bacterium RIFCSPHIGHO2_02_FULL_34_12]
MADEKINQIINNYINHAKRYILDHKKDFSSWGSIYHRFIKKDKIDPAFDYTKEMIKRMEKDRLTSQVAMQVVETLTPEVQNIKKDVLIMAVPMILGFILLITFSLLFSFARPLNFTNPFVIYYAIGMFISGMLFGFGMLQRKKVKLKTLTRTMLFQACMAYGAAKMQGQGSFGAFRILEEMKTKQGKELQIRINQPKIMYK